MNGLTKAVQDVLAERQRQREKWGDTHDDEHTNDSLAYGAVSYLLPGQKPMPADWAYKSKVIDREPRREQLVKGAAIALAAVEQFDRTHGVAAADAARCSACCGSKKLVRWGTGETVPCPQCAPGVGVSPHQTN